VGANALLTQNTGYPDGSLILGSPAKKVRDLTEEEIARCRRTADGYVRNVARYGQDFADF
jgi:carbonic anhydrase/acetyltransferase-like protein (isoleucine patch superfamily)